MKRRRFLQTLGLGAGGLALGIRLPRAEANPGTGLQPNVFVHVASDGLVTLVCHRSEMGQGVRSTLPVLFADELGADRARCRTVQADGDPIYGDQNTDGSSSVRKRYEELRRMAATARVMLIEVAARRWKVSPSECEAHGHAVHHPPSKRTLGFGALADDAGKLAVPPDAPLRPDAELHLSGKPLPVVDAPDIVTGRAVFGADLRLPGMWVAVIARPPVVGGKVARFDGTRALAVPGVKRIVELPAPALPYKFQPWGGIAVVATDTWAAMRGRAALEIEWDGGEHASYDSARYKAELLKTVRSPSRVVRHVGDVDAALGKAARKLEAEYYVPHLAHLPMEPPVALARVNGGSCEVWTATQNPQEARKEAARALGFPEKNVTVHVTLLGGAFGRKSKADFVSEACLIAREVGAPVRVQWTREDDLAHDYYHTVSAQRLQAGLDKSGKVTSWLHRIAFPSISSTFEREAVHASDGELQQGVLDLPLAIPNVRAENGEARAHVRVGWYRSVCNIFHAFAANSFFDELAHARGVDPRENLLELLGPARVVAASDLGVAKVPNYGASLSQHPIDVGRYHRVIERVTELSRWSARREDGRALGLAAHRSFLTYVAVVLSVKQDGARLRCDEAWIVADGGKVLNLDRAQSQMEGAVIFGLSLAFYGGATFKRGMIEQSNFRDYKLLRIAEAPRIHVEMLPSEAPPGGLGEPGVPPVAPALTNAIFALNGKRLRELPIQRA